MQEDLLKILDIAFLSRYADEKMNNLVKQNKGAGFFLSVKGHEIIGSVFSCVMKKEDWSFPYYRDRAFALGKGCPLWEILAAFLARDIENHSSGRMMPDHFSDVKRNIPCQSSVVGSQFLQAVGVAKGLKMQKKDSRVYVSAGDGATSQGDFHEALNFACIEKLPITFVIQDNGYAISTTKEEQTAGSIENIARGYQGLNVFSVKGWEIEKLYKIAKEAVQKTPSLTVVKVPRLGPHTISDDPKKYKSLEIIEKEKKEDPLIFLEKFILEKGFLSKEEMDKRLEDLKNQVEEASKRALEVPFPKKETALDNLFKDFSVKEISLPSNKEEIFMKDGLNKALIESMEEDDKVLVFGQDVAKEKGGVFGITKSLTKYFGDRCFNTPLAESTIAGLAIGLSFVGYKPVAEIQFSDYCWTGINQIINELASIYYRSNGGWSPSVVIRMTYGGYVQGGPYHSQSNEAIFAHIPGLKIAIPSNARDAELLLKTAIKDPNPVIFLEEKALYRESYFCKRREPEKKESLPFGKANIVKEGKDITLVAWGKMVSVCYKIIQEMDVSIELIDLRTLVPMDLEAILSSLKKTGKLLIVHEANLQNGFGAEISAKVMEEGFFLLDAPIKRVGAKDRPVPYCKDLEDEILPQKEDIKKAILGLKDF